MSTALRFGFPLAAFLATASAMASCSGGDDAAAPATDASTDTSTAADAAAGDSGSEDAADAGSLSHAHIGAGDDYSCAIVSGAVECWGRGDFGNLGRPAPIGVNPPGATVPSVSATLFSVGWVHVCANGASGTQCWGFNRFGQLDRTDLDASAVGPAPDVSGNVKALALGWFHSCALIDTSVKCWGEPIYGELGFEPDGSVASPIPSVVPLPGPADQVAVGFQAGCARLVADGSVWCWGGDHMGELALPPDGGYSSTPVRIGTLSGVLQVAMGSGTACALLSDHTVTCWGRNAGSTDNTLGGLLGHDPNTDENCQYGKCDPTPTPVGGLSDVYEIAVGSGHACAISSIGTVGCWGDNTYGQLGHDPADDSDGGGGTLFTFNPAGVAGLSNVIHLAAGLNHTCAETRDEHFYCWGSDAHGELGSVIDGSTQSFVPIEVPGL